MNEKEIKWMRLVYIIIISQKWISLLKERMNRITQVKVK